MDDAFGIVLVVEIKYIQLFMLYFDLLLFLFFFMGWETTFPSE